MTQICHAEISLVLSMFTLHVGNVIRKVYASKVSIFNCNSLCHLVYIELYTCVKEVAYPLSCMCENVYVCVCLCVNTHAYSVVLWVGGTSLRLLMRVLLYVISKSARLR